MSRFVARRQLLAALAAVIAFAGLGVVAAPASSARDGANAAAAASAPCYFSTCKGKNPQTTGCGDDATTIDSFDNGNFYVELRHSTLCGAAWTRITTHKGDVITACDITVGQIRSYTATDARKDVYYVDSVCNGSGAFTTGGQAYTKMLSFADYVRACTADFQTDSPDTCTNRH